MNSPASRGVSADDPVSFSLPLPFDHLRKTRTPRSFWIAPSVLTLELSRASSGPTSDLHMHPPVTVPLGHLLFYTPTNIRNQNITKSLQIGPVLRVTYPEWGIRSGVLQHCYGKASLDVTGVEKA